VNRELWSRAYLQAVEALTRERIRALYRVAIDFDRRFPSRVGLLESWRGEMLVIEGSNDPLVSKKTRASMRIAYPLAETAILPGAGHGRALERPEEWRDLVARFLKGR
jgi:pimeloyl-ACP methyl ester carboxylesterase